MKFFCSLVATTLLVAAPCSAFVPSLPTAAAKVLPSTTTPEDFVATTTNLPESVLERLNQDKVKRGKPLIETILDPNYNTAIATAVGGPLAALLWSDGGSPTYYGILGAALHTVLATLLWFQTRRVRCVLEEDGLEFYNVVLPKDASSNTSNNAAYNLRDPTCQSTLQSKPFNFVTKTKNKWAYDSITGYQFLPFRSWPLVCYFQETQTPQAYNIPGQCPHLAPVLFDAESFVQELQQRGVSYGFGNSTDE